MKAMTRENVNFSKKLMMLAAAIAAMFLVCTAHSKAGNIYTVRVESGYLALRTAMAFDSSNEIGKLYTGDTVEVTEYTSRDYWWVYAPSLGRSGYVNCNYLVGSSAPAPTSNKGTASVRVESGYLALRTAKAFDSSNEIGKLYTGDTVEIQDTSEGTYWWVYAPTLRKSGYVNSNYLVNIRWNGSNNSQGYNGATLGSMTVRVESGYLALRTAKAFDSANEIGKLYTGQSVDVIDTSDSTYWWVYAPTLGKQGYVNRNYLVGNISSRDYLFTRTVRVDSGYLALRTAKAFDSSNEIGKLYTGQTVEVQDTSEGTYWWVYAPTLGKSGYVNSNYLY